MEHSQILERVKKEIKIWEMQQIERKQQIFITDKAIEFIVEMIDNIVKDPSEYWKLRDKNAFQELAIARIPNALDLSIHHNQRFRRHIFFEDNLVISSWEIWYSLSRILERFCFIPEKDM